MTGSDVAYFTTSTSAVAARTLTAMIDQRRAVPSVQFMVVFGVTAARSLMPTIESAFVVPPVFRL